MKNGLKIRSEIASRQTELCLLKLRMAVIKDTVLFKEYNPNQPRVPAGQTGAGRWTDGNVTDAVSQPQNQNVQTNLPLALAASQKDCDEQYRHDLIVCQFTGLRTCYAQAMVRLVACARGHPITPLNF